MSPEFEEIYDRYGARVHAFLARMTGDRWIAEELTQETFIRYLRHRHALRSANGSLGPWFFRVASRLVLDSRRRKRPGALGTAEPRDPDADVEEAAAVRDLADRIRNEVDRLEPPLRAAFLLRVQQELTFPQIAVALEVSERTAKDRFRRARDRIHQRLAPLRRELRS